MTLDEALWRDKERMSGAVCFRGTRIPVATLFYHLEANQMAEFYLDFPDVSEVMVKAVFAGSSEAEKFTSCDF